MSLSRSTLVPSLVLASSLVLACGQPPVPVSESQSSGGAPRAGAPAAGGGLPDGHPPIDGGGAPPAPEGHGGGAPTGDQVEAAEFHFAGTLSLTEELHAKERAAVFLSVRSRDTNELLLSTRHTMDRFNSVDGAWTLDFRLDDSNRMMGGTSRPREVVVKALFSPMGMLPPIGSTQPLEGAVEAVVDAEAGADGLALTLE